MMTHDSFNVSEEVVRAFESANNTRLEVIKAGDAGAALNQAILSKENPLADAFFGVDNTFLGRALENDLFVPYNAQGLDAVPEKFQLDPQHRVTPIDYGDVCLNYDKSFFKEKSLAPPASLEDLIKPEYKGLTVVENPATSSPGLSFLITTVGHFGETGWEDYWRQLQANDVLVTDGWEDAYYGQFSGGSGKGSRPIVVSYASSPPAEVYFAEPQPAEAPTAAVTGDETCFRQIEFAGVLRNAKNPELAQKLIDFMLSQTFQEDIPLQMFVFPVNPGATLPEVFVKYAAIPETPVDVSYEAINANREVWIERWTDVVLR
ncbi:MAG TPA: thiamine ABC transporter substrate-binding protein [Chloroflexi bacterium]|nr:thiamine ABC transporter substrate-binding protein [Chloroflexota bacterium]